MKSLILISLLVSQAAGIQKSPHWESFSVEGHFKILMPHKPTELPPLLHPITKIPNPTFSAKDKHQAYRISYYCFSQARTNAEDVEIELQAARNRTVVALSDESRNLTVEKEEQIDHKGMRGLEITLDSKTTSYIGRIYVAKSCGYLLLVSRKNKRPISEEARMFLDSFEGLR